VRLSALNDYLNAGYIDIVGPRRGEKILDLGCGLGQFTIMMAEKAGYNSVVVGVERDERQLAEARKHLENRSGIAAHVDFREGDAMDLQLKDEWGSFDLAHTRFLLEHLPDPVSAVAGMVRALRPGGRLFISDDDHDVFRLTPEPAGFRELWGAYVRSYEVAGNDPYIGRNLVRILHDAGLVPIRNGGMFFGGSADEPHFGMIADNLIGILEGAGETMIGTRMISRVAYKGAMDALRSWKSDPAASQWYMLCWAEGIIPITPDQK